MSPPLYGRLIARWRNCCGATLGELQTLFFTSRCTGTLPTSQSQLFMTIDNICISPIVSVTVSCPELDPWTHGFFTSRILSVTGVDRWGTGGGTRPHTFQLGGDHIGNVPPPLFCLKSGKSHVFCLLLTYIRCQPA